MKRMFLSTARLATLLLALGALFLAGCATGGAGAPGEAKPKPMPSHKYVCGCGPECLCGTSCDKPSSCPCGKPLVRKKVLREDLNVFYACPDPACKLETADKNDPTKCACGQKQKVFKKKGKYTCVCGKGCDCGCTSNQPGNCACGKPMY